MKKILPAILTISLLLTLFAGCSAAPAVESSTKPVESTAAPSNPVESTEAPTELSEDPSKETTEPAVEEEVYTIRFDLNTTPDDITDDETFEYEVSGYDEYWQPIVTTEQSVLTVARTENAYIASAIPAPEREGYAFAGWQTRPNVTEADLVNGVSPYLWLFGTQSNYGDETVVMRIADMESLDANGVGTLYARWVEVKEISTEEELRAIAEDLYGAYRLAADIELTEAWTPVGLYFSNYEFYATEWWTYAFRGSLDGNGHTISGLNILGAQINIDAYTAEGTVWHNDGERADGCAAMFGSISSATIQNLTLDAPVIDVTGDNAIHGDYIYAASVAAFDMGSALTNVTVNEPCVRVEITDEASAHLPSMFVAASGMIGGGWTDTLTACTVNGGTVELNANTAISHGGEIYVGGLVGECYSTMTGCSASAELIANVTDDCEAAEDAELKVNVGGLSAASTVNTASQVNAVVRVAVSKPTGASNVSVGGMSGSQRYLTSTGNTVKAEITTDCDLDEELGLLNVGAVSGQIDVYYVLQILMYTPVASAGCTENTTEVTVNGETVETVIGLLPQLDGQPLRWINKGEYEIAEGYVVPSNIEAVAEVYGSYLPVEYLQDGIIWIQAE